MNRHAQSFRSKSVTVDGAKRNTYLHKQVGVKGWARQDSNLTTKNTSSDIENAESEQSLVGGVAESASLIEQSEQMFQLLALLQELSSDEIELLLRLVSKLKRFDS